MAQQQELKIQTHRVLIVDDEPTVGHAIRKILDTLKVTSEYAEDAETGLRCIEAATESFSLIICDQRMPGMKGTEFLARAKEITPATIRYLITGYSDMDTIINAVNKGAVQHYISKPMEMDDMITAVKRGLQLYEHHLEKEQLFTLAKEQNAKLYELNSELVEAAKKREAKRKDLESEIDDIQAQLNEAESTPAADPSAAVAVIREYAEGSESEGDESKCQERFNRLYLETLKALHHSFTDLALKNGMEMPEIEQSEPEGSRA